MKEMPYWASRRRTNRGPLVLRNLRSSDVSASQNLVLRGVQMTICNRRPESGLDILRHSVRCHRSSKLVASAELWSPALRRPMRSPGRPQV